MRAQTVSAQAENQRIGLLELREKIAESNAVDGALICASRSF